MTVFFLLMALLMAGLLPRWRGSPVAVAAAAGLWLWGWNPAATLFVETLEGRYPVQELPVGEAEAIVVLGGSTYPPNASQPEALPGYDTYLRCLHGAMLYRRWKPLPVVATGGLIPSRGRWIDGTQPMRQVLEAGGVPAEKIWLENRSANTYDNGVNTAALLRSKRIRRVALVTEAHHMLRAQRVFEKQGLEVIPAPCAYRAERFEGTWRDFALPHSATFKTNEDTLHEWLGYLWYAAKGRL